MSPSEPTNQPTYVWSRIEPRRSRLIRDKLLRETQIFRRQFDKEARKIRFNNRFNCNKTGVEQQIVSLWAREILAHAETCHEKIFCHHWNLLGNKKTAAFMRACSAILGRHIELLGNGEASKARMSRRRGNAISMSLEESYRCAAKTVRRELEEIWDIEARELDLAASIAISQKHTAPPPPLNIHSRNDQNPSSKGISVAAKPLQATQAAGKFAREQVAKTRAADVVRARDEIAQVRDRMNCDADYDLLKTEHPNS